MENKATYQQLADNLKSQWENRKDMLEKAHDNLSEAIERLKMATDRERKAWQEYHDAQTASDKETGK